MSVQTCLSVVDASVTVPSTASTTVLVAATYNIRNFLMVANPDASITVWVNFAGGTAVANGAGCTELTAGQNVFFETFVPTNAITARAASGTPNLTIQYA